MSRPRPDQPSNPFYVLDTKNLFGFLEGADVGEKGDRSLEFETTGSFGGAQGLYSSLEQEFIFENTLTDLLGLELGAHVLGQDIRHVPDLPDFVGVNFMGVSAEFRYVVMHRTAAVPIQVTLTVQPEYNAHRRRRPAGQRFQRDFPRRSQTSYPAIGAFMARSISSMRRRLRGFPAGCGRTRLSFPPPPRSPIA